MSKILDCADITGHCGFRAVGDSDEEVLQMAAEHARNEHGVVVTPELVQRARAAIRDNR